jgi:Zn-dependent protease with chaperone function
MVKEDNIAVMDLDRFKDYIIELEDYQKIHPVLFKLWILLLLILGYSYMFIILLILVITLVAFIYASVFNFLCQITIPFILISIYFCIKGIIRMLNFRIKKPEGIEITPNDAPKLFEIIEIFRKELNCPKIHKVLIDNNDNAYVLQIPLLGVFGPTRNYIVLGMPILMQLGNEHLEAVLAHEMGHISHLHNKFTRWILRVRDPWINL